MTKLEIEPRTTFEEFPDDITKALKRADAWWYNDMLTNIRHIKSGNKEEPLTVEEKKRIKNYLALQMCPIEVVFDD